MVCLMEPVNWADTKALLKSHFAPCGNEQTHRLWLNTMMIKRGESIAAFALCVRKTTSMAYPELSTECRDDMMVGAFIRGIDAPVVTRQVTALEMKEFNQVVQLANRLNLVKP